jgi:hypothetical protein
LTERRWHSSVVDIQSFRKVDCDNGHYLVVAKVWERLAVGISTQKFYMERFSLKKLNEVKGKEQYQVNISHTFTAL